MPNRRSWLRRFPSAFAAILFLTTVNSLVAQTWTNVTTASGAVMSGSGSGASWGDYDNDGRLDLFLSAQPGASGGRVWLYRNLGGGAFQDRTVAAGLGGVVLRNAVWGDYNNDGRLDLLAISFNVSDRPRLYRNNGDGTFSDVAAAAGLAVLSMPHKAAWADYDRDGWLDFFVSCGQGASSPNQHLFRNNEDGTFTDVAIAAGIAPAISIGLPYCAWGDYDNDGRPDLYIGNNVGANLLYHNLGNGTFENVSAASGANDGRKTAGVVWGDYNNDGRLDLYLVNIASDRNTLLRNNGNGTFTDVTAAAGVSDVGDGRGCTFLDYNADGWLDILATNHTADNRLYRNNGNNTFTNVAAAAGIVEPSDGFGIAVGDCDGDGDLDIYFSTHGNCVLYQHQGTSNHYLNLRLSGTLSNRAAIGARAEVRATAGGPVMTRVVGGGQSQEGQDALELAFGLGTNTSAAEVRVHWPSGRETLLTDVPADQTLAVTEPPGTILSLPDGTPKFIAPNQSTHIRVRISPINESVAPGSPTFHYRVGGGAWVSRPMTHVAGELYDAVPLPLPCGDAIHYYFSAEGSISGLVRLPTHAPAETFSAAIATVVPFFSDDFETDKGWMVQNVTLQDGAWERGVPAGDGTNGDPTSDYDGSGKCYVTDNAPGNSDVDFGPTRLISPTWNLTGLTNPRLSYARWFSHVNGTPPPPPAQDTDSLAVELSNDGGTNWVLVENVTETTTWVFRTIEIDDYVVPTAQVRVRFSVADFPNNSQTEAGIDAVSVADVICVPGTICTRGDVNNDGFVDGRDIGPFAEAMIVAPPPASNEFCAADIDDNGELSADADVPAFLHCLLNGGCP